MLITYTPETAAELEIQKLRRVIHLMALDVVEARTMIRQLPLSLAACLKLNDALRLSITAFAGDQE
jgi:hypothetical protein